MIDFLHLPKPQNGTIDYFPGFSDTTGGSWEVWNKPRGINFIKIITISGGGGGSGLGGGGGGSASMATVMIPAIFLPDQLYVSSGVGGRGSANTTASNGVASYVSIAPSNAAIYRVCYGNGGGAGQPDSAGGGTAGALPIVTSALQAGMGNFTGLIGQVGANGSDTLTAAGSITYPTTGLLLSGGAGGGGASFAGGDIIAPASQTSTYTIFPTLPGGVAGTAGSLAGGEGVAGINNMELLLFSGGSGGGSGFDGTAGSVGGRGGDGGIGCGGGGGGAGTTGGRGGNGGPGLVIISCW